MYVHAGRSCHQWVVINIVRRGGMGLWASMIVRELVIYCEQREGKLKSIEFKLKLVGASVLLLLGVSSHLKYIRLGEKASGYYEILKPTNKNNK